LENIYPTYGCVASGRGDLDADALEHLEITPRVEGRKGIYGSDQGFFR
jgi:hypothetical protein